MQQQQQSGALQITTPDEVNNSITGHLLFPIIEQQLAKEPDGGASILQQLQLDDEEVACIMGHEAAHALREHARERMGKSSATSIGLSLGAQLLGLGSLGDAAANLGTQLLTLKFSRDDETEADLVGMELAARAGYDPEAGVRLWQKMQQASKGAPPQWMSTHPSSGTRINEIRDKLPKVLPLYAQADKPRERFEPMAAAKAPTP